MRSVWVDLPEEEEKSPTGRPSPLLMTLHRNTDVINPLTFFLNRHALELFQVLVL